MKRFLKPNIGVAGRAIRGTGALMLLVGSGFGFTSAAWLGIALLIPGLFVLFEALRGWCVLRACGVKTRF